jgi:hypothetical protein
MSLTFRGASSDTEGRNGGWHLFMLSLMRLRHHSFKLQTARPDPALSTVEVRERVSLPSVTVVVVIQIVPVRDSFSSHSVVSELGLSVLRLR